MAKSIKITIEIAIEAEEVERKVWEMFDPKNVGTVMSLYMSEIIVRHF